MIFVFILIITFLLSQDTFSLPLKSNDCVKDLSYPFDENTIYWINMKPFRFTKKIVNKEGIFYTANEFEAAEHGGTHMDAPYHFNKWGWKVGDIPIDRVFVKGIIINAKEEAAADPNYALTKEKLIKWEEKHGPITNNTVILINFGWAHKYVDINKYYGSKTLKTEDLNFPGISEEAAKWIADHEKVVGVGLDTPSADTGENSNILVAHIEINGANKFILENVALNDIELPESGFKLSITPMKIREGTGAPCRIIAWTEDCMI